MPSGVSVQPLGSNVPLIFGPGSVRLGAAVCRACYIHPVVLEAYQARTLRRAWRDAGTGVDGDGLRPEEAALMRILEGVPAAA